VGQLALDADGEELLAAGPGVPDARESVTLDRITLGHRGDRQHAQPVGGGDLHERAVVVPGDDAGPQFAALEPVVERAAQRGAQRGQEHRRAVERAREAAAHTRGQRRGGAERHAARKEGYSSDGATIHPRVTF
jgi:hypothetical protein